MSTTVLHLRAAPSLDLLTSFRLRLHDSLLFLMFLHRHLSTPWLKLRLVHRNSSLSWRLFWPFSRHRLSLDLCFACMNLTWLTTLLCHCTNYFDVKRKKYIIKTVLYYRVCKKVKYIYWVKKRLVWVFQIEETVTKPTKHV